MATLWLTRLAIRGTAGAVGRAVIIAVADAAVAVVVGVARGASCNAGCGGTVIVAVSADVAAVAVAAVAAVGLIVAAIVVVVGAAVVVEVVVVVPAGGCVDVLVEELEQLQVVLGGDACDAGDAPSVQGGIAEGRRLQRNHAEPIDSLRSYTRRQSAHQQHRPLEFAHHAACCDPLADAVVRQPERLRHQIARVGGAIAVAVAVHSAQSLEVTAREPKCLAIERAESIEHLRPQRRLGS